MKTFSALLILVFVTQSSFASTCANISGIYLMPDTKFVIKYNQTACEILERSWGVVSSDGSINFDKKIDKFKLDGTPVNTVQDIWEMFIAGQNSVDSYSNKSNGFISTDNHGYCEYHGSSLSNEKNGDLIFLGRVDHCDDGYSGSITVIFPKYK